MDSFYNELQKSAKCSKSLSLSELAILGNFSIGFFRIK